jgi:hypothetical protein
MIAIPRDVHSLQMHTHSVRGDASMENEKYAETYKLGNTIIHVVEPKGVTEEQVQRVLREFHLVGWSILEEMQEKQKQSQD